MKRVVSTGPNHRFTQTRLYCGEPKVKFCSQITPTACEIFRTKAAQFGIYQAKLLERIARVLDESEVESKILKRIAA